MSVHEACGIFGVMAPTPADVADLCYVGLQALQHRGQESCGIVVNDDGVFFSHKDLGLVSEVFGKRELESLPAATMAVVHVRYGTTGSNSRANCQPIEVNHQKGRMALAHNGNLSNATELRMALELSGAIFHSSSDTETIAYVVTRERLSVPSIEEALSRAMDTLEGAYSLVLMSPQKLICARDPHGFRPLCYGKTTDGMYVIASESCALQALGATLVRDVDPGEIIVFSKDDITSHRGHCGQAPKHLCVFEYIYFARPDSVIDGVSVHASRIAAGKILARTHPVDADVVIGAPDSGLDAALGFSRESGIPYGMGLIKNKYIGRTFIAPPFLYPCFYGTDIDSEEHLIACRHSVAKIASLIGADSLGYLPLEELACLTCGNGYCDACFSGTYPTSIPVGQGKGRFERRLSEASES